MKYIIISLLLAANLFLAVSCKETGLLQQGEVLAKVGDKTLYMSEAQQIFTDGMNPEDSIKVLENFIDIWVKKQLKVREAEKVFSGSSDDIEKKVEEYRNSLLTLRLDQYYIDTRLDSLYDDAAVKAYYDNNKADFLLDRPIVKGRIVKIPDNYRQLNQLKEMMTAGGEKYQDFVEISKKNDFDLTEYDKWVDLSTFVAAVPAAEKKDADKIFAEKGVTEVKIGKDIYLIYITNKLAAGDLSPQERVEETIKQVLYTMRKQEILKQAEDSIYNAAMEDRIVEINVK